MYWFAFPGHCSISHKIKSKLIFAFYSCQNDFISYGMVNMEWKSKETRQIDWNGQSSIHLSSGNADFQCNTAYSKDFSVPLGFLRFLFSSHFTMPISTTMNLQEKIYMKSRRHLYAFYLFIYESQRWINTFLSTHTFCEWFSVI